MIHLPGFSSGTSSWAELDAAVGRLRHAGVGPLAVLQCTSAYPSTPARLGLKVLAEIGELPVRAAGLSDHSGTIFPGLASAALGGRVIEVHVTLSRQMFGPDVVASTSDQRRASCARRRRPLHRSGVGVAG